MLRVYTLGTSKRGEEEFIKILKKYKIETIFDVRRFPTSQFPHFQRERLEEICQREGVEYIYSGKELGGYRKGGYQNWMKGEEFKRGISLIREKAKGKTVCLLCAERVPFFCHRRFIAQELERKGVSVVHIMEIDKTNPKGF